MQVAFKCGLGRKPLRWTTLTRGTRKGSALSEYNKDVIFFYQRQIAEVEGD